MAGEFEVAVMHDYFVDRLVAARPLESLLSRVRAKASEGGGGIHGVEQSEISGGNAVNLARALAALGLRTVLITHSDPSHEPLLRRAFRGLDVAIRLKPLSAGLTVAFEGRVNVMLGDAGGAGRFAPSLLDAGDWEALKSSKVVCSVNWAANRRGTELLTALRDRLGKRKTIFLDPADVRDRMSGYGALLKLQRKARVLDWLSVNEQEAAATAELLKIASRSTKEMCRAIAEELKVRVDIHSDKSSCTSRGSGVSEVRCAKARPKRLTGAGDVWDAAAIYGALSGMGESRRLKFANAAAKLYLEAEEPRPPTLDLVTAAAA